MRFVGLAAVAAMMVSAPASATTTGFDFSGIGSGYFYGQPIPPSYFDVLFSVDDSQSPSAYQYNYPTGGFTVSLSGNSITGEETEGIPYILDNLAATLSQSFTAFADVTSGPVTGSFSYTEFFPGNTFAGSLSYVTVQILPPNIGTAPFFFLTFGSPVPLPEPSSWAMMLAGLGLAGYALRRRPRAIAAFG